jgi:hypothetical protein
LPLRSAPDRRALRQLALAHASGPVAKRLRDHLIVRWPFGLAWSTLSLPTARFRQTRIPSSAAIWMLDPFALASATTVALAPAKTGQTLLLLVRRLGASAVTTRRYEAGKYSATRMRCRNVNRRLIHLLRTERRNQGTMRRSVKSCSRGLGRGRLRVWN